MWGCVAFDDPDLVQLEKECSQELFELWLTTRLWCWPVLSTSSGPDSQLLCGLG